ncbi:major capsid protein [Capybara microvirus Cap1_SP_206]|nr:major capsid protein [Capybara microvirus Cap1_SP_206]
MSDLMHDFGVNKTEKLQRSRWQTKLKTKTAVAQGNLVPLGFYDVIPGSFIEDDVEQFTRLALTPLKPFMGDVYLTYGAYFVPYRILFKKFPDMYGNGKPSEWSDPQEWVFPGYRLLTISSSFDCASMGAGYDCVETNSSKGTGNSSVNSSGYVISKVGNLADYLGIPLTYSGTQVIDNGIYNVAPFLAYERIWSDYWRDENYQNPDPDLEKGFELSSGAIVGNTFRFALHKSNRFHDYLTSLLPNTQKGNKVSAFTNLVTGPSLVSLKDPTTGATSYNIQFGNNSGTLVNSGVIASNGGNIGVSTSSTPTVSQTIQYTNLGVSIDVDELRSIFALKRASERNARTGSRAMSEAMRGIFEADPPIILNESEFLGGNTIRLNLSAVPQTGSEAGKLGAFSATRTGQKSFRYTFNEPGILMYVGTIRCRHNYPQSLERIWSKRRRYDFYDPAFAHISEQPVYRREAVLLSDDPSDGVIGFQEPWLEYEKPVDKVTGYLRDYTQSKDITAWCLNEDYGTGSYIVPSSYYPEPNDTIAKNCIDYSNSRHSFQFIIDFEANLTITAPKPVYSIPGFIDHLLA